MAKKKKLNPVEELINELLEDIEGAAKESLMVAYDEGYAAGEDAANEAANDKENA